MRRDLNGIAYVGKLKVGTEIERIDNSKAEYRFALQLAGPNPLNKTCPSLFISLTDKAG